MDELELQQAKEMSVSFLLEEMERMDQELMAEVVVHLREMHKLEIQLQMQPDQRHQLVAEKVVTGEVVQMEMELRVIYLAVAVAVHTKLLRVQKLVELEAMVKLLFPMILQK
jgi:transcriptional antiterminator Rof (Rho-off)